MKTCTKCKIVKPLEDFHKHPVGKQGVSPQCKVCEKERKRKQYLLKKLDPDWVEEKRKKQREYIRKNKGRKVSRDNESYNKKYPEKYKAVYLSKRIKVPKGFQRHHWSYLEENAKDIIPLSIKDHNILHTFLDYDPSKMMYRCNTNIGSFEQGDLLDSKQLHIDYFISLKLSDLWRLN